MRLLRWPEVRALVRLSRTTIWRLETAGAFPRRRRLSLNSVAWLEHEVIEWIRQRDIIGAAVEGGDR